MKQRKVTAGRPFFGVPVSIMSSYSQEQCVREFPLWLSGNKSAILFMRMQVRFLASPSALRIWYCRELWCRLQTQIWCGCGYGICLGCGLKRQKKKKKKKKPSSMSFQSPVHGAQFVWMSEWIPLPPFTGQWALSTHTPLPASWPRCTSCGSPDDQGAGSCLGKCTGSETDRLPILTFWPGLHLFSTH